MFYIKIFFILFLVFIIMYIVMNCKHFKNTLKYMK